MSAVLRRCPRSVQTISVRRRLSGSRFVLYVTLAAVCGMWMLPLFSVFVTSLKSQKEMFTTPLWVLPRVPMLENFADALGLIGRGMINSVIITVLSTLFVVGFGSLCAYPLGRLRFPGRDLVYLIIVGSLTVPYASILPTLVHFLDQVHLLGTFPGIIITHVAHGQPIVVFLLARFFASIPEDIMEAARIDGASPLVMFWRIVLPLTRPALAATFIIAFTWIWSDYFKALTIVPQTALSPVTVSLAALTGQYTGQHHLRSAAALIAMAPSVLVFLGFQRFFIQGLTVGAVKG